MNKIIIIIGGTVLAGTLRLISEVIQNSLIDLSTRNGFGFGFAGLGYILFPVYYAFLGMILSIILIQISSIRTYFLVSILFSIYCSIGSIKGAYEILQRTDYFDKTYFQLDVFQICFNFIIFPLIAFFVWKAKDF